MTTFTARFIASIIIVALFLLSAVFLTNWALRQKDAAEKEMIVIRQKQARSDGIKTALEQTLQETIAAKNIAEGKAKMAEEQHEIVLEHKKIAERKSIEVHEQRNKAIEGQIRVLLNESQLKLQNNDQLGALISTVHAVRQLKIASQLPPDLPGKAIGALSRQLQDIREVNRLRFDHTALDVQFSPDGKLVGVTCDDKTIAFWNVATGQITLQSVPVNIQRLAFASDQHFLAGADNKGNIYLFNPEGRLLQNWSTGSAWVGELAFETTGHFLAAAGQNLQLWQPDGQITRTLTTTTKLTGVAIQNQIITASAWDGTVYVWDSAGHLIQKMADPDAVLMDIALSPDGKLVAVGTANHELKIWSCADGRLLQTCRGHKLAVTCVAFSHDGRRLISGGKDKTVRVWQVSDGALLETWIGHSGPITGLSAHPKKDWIASASTDGVRIWRLHPPNIANTAPDALIDTACNWLHEYLAISTDLAEVDHVCQ